MSKFWRKWLRNFLPGAAGISVGISAGILATTPTKWTWICWGLTVVFIAGLAYWVTTIDEKRGRL